MPVAAKSLENLITQKPGWKNKPTVARRFPVKFVNELEAIARRLDSGESLPKPDTNYQSLEILEIQKLRMKLSLIAEQKLLIFSSKFNSLIQSTYTQVSEEEKVFFDWVKEQVENSNQLVRIHVKNACFIINKYRPFKDKEEVENIVNTYPTSVNIVERKIDQGGRYTERTPDSYFVYRRGKIRCYSPYDESGETQSRFKKLPDYNFSSRKHGGDNSWFFSEECARNIVSSFQDFHIDNSVIGFKYYCEYKELELKKQERLKVKQKAEEFSNFLVNLDLGKYGLFDHQVSGVKWLIQRYYSDYKGCILSDEMGLGKTWTASIAAHEICCRENIRNLLIICPASLIGNWKKEMSKLGISAEIFSDSFQKIPKPLSEDYLIIVDEAHSLQNEKSKRFQSLEKLVIGKNFKGIFLLTGTPIKNGRPINLYSLLKLLNHPVTFFKNHYETRYCNAHFNQYNKWNNQGASNLEELKEKTSDCILRREKKECLNLPEKIRSLLEVPWTPTVEKKYFSLFKKAWEAHENRIESGEIKRGAEALVKTNILRQCSSELKIPWCLETVENLTAENQKVVIFSEFLETISKVSNSLKSAGISCRELIGATPSSKRTLDVEDFQEGKYEVFIGSTKAGGVGITLTNASNLILLDRPWTPGDAEQAEDRIHRIGQANTANIYWPQLGEIDKIIDTLLESKSTNIDIILAGKNVSFSSSNMVELQQQIIKYYEDEYGI